MSFDLYRPDAADIAKRRQAAALARTGGTGGPQNCTVRIHGPIDRTLFDRVAAALAAAPHADTLTIDVDSPGGLALVAFDVFILLDRHPASRKTAFIQRAESAALLPALAADKRIARAGAKVLLHAGETPLPAGSRWTAEQHEIAAADLRWLDGQFAKILCARTRAPLDVIAEAERDEAHSPISWCLEHGIIHKSLD